MYITSDMSVGHVSLYNVCACWHSASFGLPLDEHCTFWELHNLTSIKMGAFKSFAWVEILKATLSTLLHKLLFIGMQTKHTNQTPNRQWFPNEVHKVWKKITAIKSPNVFQSQKHIISGFPKWTLATGSWGWPLRWFQNKKSSSVMSMAQANFSLWVLL